MGREVDKLANTLNSRMGRVSERYSTITAEIGRVTANLALQVPSLTNAIDAGDYSIAQGLELTSGDSVLLIWAGNEPVITAIIG